MKRLCIALLAQLALSTSALADPADWTVTGPDNLRVEILTNTAAWLPEDGPQTATALVEQRGAGQPITRRVWLVRGCFAGYGDTGWLTPDMSGYAQHWYWARGQTRIFDLVSKLVCQAAALRQPLLKVTS